MREALRLGERKRLREAKVPRSLDIEVTDCARCDEDHEAVKVQEFKTYMVCGEYVMTHWGTCPKSGEPILVANLGLDVEADDLAP